MDTLQVWPNSGSYLTTLSSLSQNFCPGSHPEIFVPQARPALAEETSASFLAQSGISRQGGLNLLVIFLLTNPLMALSQEEQNIANNQEKPTLNNPPIQNPQFPPLS